MCSAMKFWMKATQSPFSLFSGMLKNTRLFRFDLFTRSSMASSRSWTHALTALLAMLCLSSSMSSFTEVRLFSKLLNFSLMDNISASVLPKRSLICDSLPKYNFSFLFSQTSFAFWPASFPFAMVGNSFWNPAPCA